MPCHATPRHATPTKATRQSQRACTPRSPVWASVWTVCKNSREQRFPSGSHRRAGQASGAACVVGAQVEERNRRWELWVSIGTVRYGSGSGGNGSDRRQRAAQRTSVLVVGNAPLTMAGSDLSRVSFVSARDTSLKQGKARLWCCAALVTGRTLQHSSKQQAAVVADRVLRRRRTGPPG
jgi:hypothetical protein